MDNKYDDWKHNPTPKFYGHGGLTPPAVPEAVNHPQHYTAHPSGIEAITITSGFCFSLGNVIKYVWRAGLKSPDPLPDLKKALWYLQYHIKALEDARHGGGRGANGGGPSNGAGH